MGHLERRITHQDIDSAKFSSGAINHRSTVSRIGQVAAYQHTFAAGVLSQPGDLSSVLVLIEIRDQHVCAFACIRDGHCPADTAVAAGDHGTFTGQPARATVAILAAIWDRAHCRLNARNLLLLLRKSHSSTFPHARITGDRWMHVPGPGPENDLDG